MILKLTLKNKLAYILWFLKKVESDLIKTEDIYKWKEYFDIFNRRKNEFPVKDINQIKTKEDLDEFIQKILEIKDIEKNFSKRKGVDKLGKYDKLKIGEVDGFNVYKIPKGNTDEKYYNAACDLGSGTEWCTATGKTDEWFKQHSRSGSL